MLPSGKIAQMETKPKVFLYDFFIIYLLGEGSQEMTDSNSTKHTPAEDGLPVSQTPIYAFVSSFLFAPLALYFGHSALSEMRKGTISSSNKGWAQAALIIAYSFLALGLAALVYWIWMYVTIFGLLQRIPQ